MDKGQILNFYDNIVTQATGYNIFILPSNELSSSNGAVPDYMSPECKSTTAMALYSKLSHPDTIDTEYTDAHNLLATKIDGYVFLQLLVQQVHPILAITNIATIDIPKYSKYKNLFRYTREIVTYVENHGLKNRSYTDREVTNMFLSHLDNPDYSSVIK